jgi:hypothetical protein
MKKTVKKTSSSKYLLPIILVASLFALSLGLYAFNAFPTPMSIGINQITNATGEVSLTLSPANVSAAKDTESTITLTANTGSAKLVVLAIELTYDPAKVSTPTVTPGSFLGNTLMSPKVENGKITFTLAATPESGGASGNAGQIATIKLKPIAGGSSALSFTENTIATAIGSNGERIPNNSLKSATDAVITVGGGSSSNTGNNNVSNPTPTPTTAPPAQNNSPVVTPTPKSTTKPKTTTAPISPTTPSNETYQDPDNVEFSEFTEEESGYLDESEPVGTVTDTTVPKSPSLLKKAALGWGIIFKYLFALN